MEKSFEDKLDREKKANIWVREKIAVKNEVVLFNK